MTKSVPPRESPIWAGRPAIGVYLAIYLLVALIAMVVLDFVEFYIGLPKGAAISRVYVPYPIQIITDIVIFLVFLSSSFHLLLLRARSKYELYVDGLNINTGIISLQNTYVAPMAFSDARLIRTLLLRLAGRGLIIVDTNDHRHFRLELIKNPMEVQSLIRRALSHPTFRTEVEARDLSNDLTPKKDATKQNR